MHLITRHLPVKEHRNECMLQGMTRPFPQVKQTAGYTRRMMAFWHCLDALGWVFKTVLHEQLGFPGFMSIASSEHAKPATAKE